MVTIREYAKKSGLSYAHVKELCDKNKLKHELTPGGHYQIYDIELDRLKEPQGFVPREEYEKALRELEKAKASLSKIREAMDM